MIRRKTILVTGANGEVGHGLIQQLAAQPNKPAIIALDLKELDSDLRPFVYRSVIGDILDNKMLERLTTEYEIETIFHLAALLSTSSEFNPESAHAVNVQGTVNLLKLAIDQGRWSGQSVKFIYASSIAAYGLPNLETKRAAGRVTEDQYLNPTTMYGCNKLYCEHLGRYYALHYQQLSALRSVGVDFRCVRFPGLVSAMTVPTGGTSDYAPEMLHAAAQGHPYACFVRVDTTIPFMAMPDAIKALLTLANAPRENLTHFVYNVTSFSRSAKEFSEMVKAAFPNAQITFETSYSRQAIVDTWPADMDDSAARRDWGWSPDYDADRAFNDYLIPTISQRYKVNAE
ncbi:MAG TPA: NAD-dependent epimerase/dehydratase family protein [Aggregatilineaceae bacterium]|nr:NAD-dependent epimerase/dehydratase family protein [Aggregatilineaceae bacterium]